MEIIESKEKAAFAKALAKAQKMVLAATKDANNPFFNSKYATLAEVLATVRDPLADNGFALIQDADTDLVAGTVGVVTRLIHESGFEMASPRLSATLKDEFNKAGDKLPPSVQQIGSMVTYLRRYGLTAFLSVAIEDDDGNEVTQIGKGGDRPVTQPAPGRTSAHTGEKLNTTEAVDRHIAAAESTKKPVVYNPAPAAPSAPAAPAMINWIQNKPLLTALIESGINAESLEAYLKGTLGEPRISAPLLRGEMKLSSLGDKIISSLLAPNNWKTVVARIKAEDNIPF